jgi:hypothetical protein
MRLYLSVSNQFHKVPCSHFPDHASESTLYSRDPIPFYTHSLVVGPVLLQLLVTVVMLVGVSLLFSLGKDI